MCVHQEFGGSQSAERLVSVGGGWYVIATAEAFEPQGVGGGGGLWERSGKMWVRCGYSGDLGKASRMRWGFVYSGILR